MVMFHFDFLIFYFSGRAVWEGTSPYLVDGFISPYPLAVLFAPLALLTVSDAYVLYLAVNLFLLWKTMRRRMIWALLAFPVLFTLYVGQIDMVLALGIGLVPWLLPLAIVKPQVGFVLAPWIVRRYSRLDWWKAAGVGGAFLALCFIMRPTWVGEWLAAQPQVNSYSIRASNLYYLVPAEWMDVRIIVMTIFTPLALVAAFWIKDRQISWTTAHLLAPLTNIYSAAILTEWIGPIELVVSYLPVFLTGGYIYAGLPMYFVGLTLLVRQLWQRRKE
jgi:hypothetical protein